LHSPNISLSLSFLSLYLPATSSTPLLLQPSQHVGNQKEAGHRKCCHSPPLRSLVKSGGGENENDPPQIIIRYHLTVASTHPHSTQRQYAQQAGLSVYVHVRAGRRCVGVSLGVGGCDDDAACLDGGVRGWEAAPVFAGQRDLDMSMICREGIQLGGGRWSRDEAKGQQYRYSSRHLWLTCILPTSSPPSVLTHLVRPPSITKSPSAGPTSQPTTPPHYTPRSAMVPAERPVSSSSSPKERSLK